MKRHVFILVPLLACLVVSAAVSHAKDLGVFGAVYAIAEKDALIEIEERAAKRNLNQMVNKDELTKKLKNYTPEDLKSVKDLPPPRKERTFLVDMTYTLEQDIADDKGNVVYLKGYTFNPLDYVTYPNTIVILNGNSPGQVGWFKKSAYSRDLRTKLVITDGSYSDLSKTLKRPVFYATSAMIDVFQIKAVPSVVHQKGTMMEVNEIAVVEKKAP